MASAARRNPPPEILLLLAQHLDRNSLLQCIRLSREWRHTLEPLLWHHLILPPPLPSPLVCASATPSREDNDTRISDPQQPPLELILRNAPHIRRLTISRPHPALLGLSQLPEGPNGCSHLTSFSISSDVLLDGAVIALIERSKGTLRLFSYQSIFAYSKGVGLEDRHPLSCKIWTVLPQCTALRGLKLDRAGLAMESREGFFKVCRRLESLTMKYMLIDKSVFHALGQGDLEARSSGMDLDLGFDDTVSWKNGISHGRGLFPRLQRLVLIGNICSISEEIRLLEKVNFAPAVGSSSLPASPSPLNPGSGVRDLTWNKAEDPYDPYNSAMRVSFLTTRCSGLTRLDISMSDCTDNQIASILSSLPHLTSLFAQGTSFSFESLDVLIGPTRSMSRDNDPSSTCAATTVDTTIGGPYFGSQLQELNLKRCLDMDGYSIQRIMHECPNLKRFWAEPQLDEMVPIAARHSVISVDQYLGNGEESNAVSNSIQAFNRNFSDILVNNGEVHEGQRGIALSWTCLEMQELEIGMCAMSSARRLMYSSGAVALAFYQIAQLTNLESLVLCISRDATLVSIDLEDCSHEGMGIGLLQRLRGLTRLRELTIVDPQSNMTGAILDSIVDIWPGLTAFGFSLETENSSEIYSEMDRHLRMNQPHLKRITVPRATCLFDSIYFG